MSLERVIKALIGLGLTTFDAEIYVYLAKKGPNKAITLAGSLNYNKPKIHASLKHLQTRGLVTKVNIIFSALPFEEALELLIKTKKEQAQALQESKEALLVTWETKD